MPQLCKRLGITDQTLYRWRLKFGAMSEAEAARLKLLEQENAQLKKIVANRAFGHSDVEGFAAGKGGTGEPVAPAPGRRLSRAVASGVGAAGLPAGRSPSIDEPAPVGLGRVRAAV